MNYARGGVTSTFSGSARFEPLNHGGHNLLQYHEEGKVFIGSDSFAAHQRLLWDVGSEPPTVYFDEAQGERTPENIVTNARFFHTIELNHLDGQPAPFEHHCDPDLYVGRLRFSTPDAFCISWRITGPKKDGVIDNEFIRVPEADRGAAEL
eukprot:CAMPEP_0119338622 /NCGR_PEP_ID=MMETSP1333-20130426/96523_1 /TAXON_ID=418940 /ORGANISM="Scyphosphaera apsteinii, Strain RCC1455" /LENGTH=150 /DNA_ID=CAMNT_0007349947 /DNA_START=129 /DNA_END=581 /DNA_ORIENTATION=-